MNNKGQINKLAEENCSELIDRVRNNSNGAFKELVKRYQDMVFNLCYRIIGNYDDASDAAQESFIKVYKNISKFQKKSKFSTWLYRITINTCRNWLASSHARTMKRSVRLNDDSYTNAKHSKKEIIDDSFLPEKLLIDKEVTETVEKAVDALPYDLKLLIILREFEGHSYKIIEEITGINQGTIKSRLARARRELRTLLRGWSE